MVAINKNISQNSFALRRSVAPYVGLFIILILVALMTVPYMIRTHDLTPLGILTVGFFMYSIFPLIGLRYRIWWQDGKIVQKAANGAITTIGIDEIKRIEQETSDLQTLLSLSRPFRRITTQL